MSKTILLADDSVTIQKVIELTFIDQDYEVVAVSNGDDAVARLEEGGADLVIADIHMPGASGYEVARRSKQLNPGIPVLLLVGSFEPFDEGELAACGAEAHLKKPFDSQELLSLVARLMTGEASAPEGDDPFVLDTELDDDSFSLSAAALDDAEEGAGVTDEATWGNLELDETGIEDEIEGEEEGEDDGTSPFILGGDDLEGPEPATPQPSREPSSVAGWSPAPAVKPTPRGDTGAALSDADVERIARRVVELLGEGVLREVVWEVVPDLAEVVIKDRIRELESQVE
jgi:CheY-like chemotaxis protein